MIAAMPQGRPGCAPWLWTRNRDTRVVTIAIPLIEICGAFLVTATAYHGGLLVYELGVNVAKTAIAGRPVRALSFTAPALDHLPPPTNDSDQGASCI
ncbi:hypothetical protein FJV80_15120 [Mesorhizobium sp. WSM4310]|nr:hypothetical protein FJV80_15120 [Mesorhizobium sp. WSM4310]